MLSTVQFENYRCFKKSIMSFRDLTVIVGKNNAGKSTVIEALRMIAMAGNRAARTNFTVPPKTINLPLGEKGFKIHTDKLKIDLRSVVYFYHDTKAKITATFKDGSRIVIHINTDIAFACLYDSAGKIITSRTKAYKCNFDNLNILPQIGLIKENEKILSEDTIISDKDTYLSSRHFRNELLMFEDDLFDEFKKLSEESWPGLRIRELNSRPGEYEHISLMVEDSGFTSEIGLMGSGIQMWLQIIWFICRSKGSDTIILDEPDVYMHPDLQRKLLKFVRQRFKQVIIATHSIEIISEVEPRNIITIDKNSKSMAYANSSKSVQAIINGIGSVHNISLVRLANAKKCIFVEGDDLKIISKLHTRLFPYSDFSIETLPNVSLGGWSRLDEAFGASKLFFDESSDTVKCYCILDRDYYLDAEIEKQKLKAKESHLNLHIWSKKEIENYLLIPSTLFRISKLKESEFKEFVVDLNSLINGFKEDVIDQYATRLHDESRRGKEVATCNKEARSYIESHWSDLNKKLSIICGKDAISKINIWMRENYGQHCSIDKIIRNIKLEEIDQEVLDVINDLVN